MTSTSNIDKETKKKDSSSSPDSNVGGGMGKTLTYVAIIVGILAFTLKVVPQVVEKDISPQAYLESWSTFDWNSFYANIQTHTSTTDWRKRPGAKLADEGAKAKYPIILIPGFTTSGLEVWGNEECGRKYFRTRFWGTMDQAKALLADKDCWRRHMTLDPYTGGDPSPSIRLRPTEGMVAGDYFMAPYWVRIRTAKS